MDLDFDEGGGVGEWYAPDFRGNRDLPEEQRAMCLCTPMTGREYAKAKRGALIAGAKTPAAIAASVGGFEERLKREVVRKHVTELRGWFAKDDAGQRAEIKTIDKLLDLLAAKSRQAKDAEALLDELFAHIIGESTLGADTESE